MRIAIATFEGMPPQFRDDELLLEQLRSRGAEVEWIPWGLANADWAQFDLVVARTPWDYTLRHAEFLDWTVAVGDRLENSPALIAWNSDKRYLADLAADGLPVVDTAYVAPGEETPAVERQVVVKPTVSAGGRETGRFSPASSEEARRLIERIHAAGRTAMVQPFLASVESDGETAVVTIDGEVSHVLRKRAVLRPDEVAPVRDDGLGAAEAMYDPELVVAGSAADDEIELAHRVLATIRDRFETVPLIARVDMVRGPDDAPVVLELEAIEPNLYFEQAPGAAARLADAIIRRAARRH